MTIELICEERPVAWKHHRCFHCYRHIAPGVTHRKSVLKYDHLYSLRIHDDCDDLWNKYFVDAGYRWSDFECDGHPPIYDDWMESGEFQNLCGQYRGLFPHAITRIEFTAGRSCNDR